MIDIKTNELLEIFPNSSFINKRDVIVKEIYIDSRLTTENSLFAAVKGEHHDGHSFIKQATQNGAIAVLAEKPENSSDIFQIIVPDTVKALGILANFVRRKLKASVFGITGSMGKTTVKDILYHLLNERFNTKANKGNLNNHIGLPLTIFRADENTEILITEMGINHFNEMDYLLNIAEPDAGLISNIAGVHLEFLIDENGVLKEKRKLFDFINKNNGFFALNIENKYLKKLRKEKKSKTKLYTYGFSDEADFYAENIESGIRQNGLSFLLNGKFRINVPIFGKHNVINVLAGVAAAYHYIDDLEYLCKRLNSLKITKNRMKVEHIKNYTIINDAYNASPESMKAGLQFLSNERFPGIKAAVLGDMFELGKNEREFHKEIGLFCRNLRINSVYCIGDLSLNIFNAGLDNDKPIFHHLKNQKQLIDILKNSADVPVLIYFKASNGMKFSKLIEDFKKEVERK